MTHAHPGLQALALPALVRAAALPLLLALAGHAAAAEPARFAGHWLDCEAAKDTQTCYGYHLRQDGDQVCGTLSRRAPTGQQDGYLRGKAVGELLMPVEACGPESAWRCPTIKLANRRGLLLCDGQLYETGGRRSTCEEQAHRQQFRFPYQRISAEEFQRRFGEPDASLCAAPAAGSSSSSAPR